MIDHHTIKFGPAVSQKELEKLLNAPLVTKGGETVLEPGDKIFLETVGSNLHKLKVRVEFVGDFEDVKKVKELMKQLSKQ